jgi:hypothetical protein
MMMTTMMAREAKEEAPMERKEEEMMMMAREAKEEARMERKEEMTMTPVAREAKEEVPMERKEEMEMMMILQEKVACNRSVQDNLFSAHNLGLVDSCPRMARLTLDEDVPLLTFCQLQVR